MKFERIIQGVPSYLPKVCVAPHETSEPGVFELLLSPQFRELRRGPA